MKYWRLDASLDHLPRLHLLFVENFADAGLPRNNFCDVERPATQNRQPLQSSVLTSSGRMSTNVQLPVAVEQERIPRRNTFTGVLSGNVR